MDYKYIEQLLERYWQCETSVEEEAILRSFFAQRDIPAHLARYQSLFDYQHQAAQTELSEAFDQRLLSLIEAEKPVEVKARRITMTRRLMPLYRAAASVAIVLLIVPAAWKAFDHPQEVQGWDYNASAYTDSYSSPQEAYEQIDVTIRDLQDVLGIKATQIDVDSLQEKVKAI